MNNIVFKETWLQMARNPKNRLLAALIFLVILAYSFFFIPHQQSFDTIDYHQLEINLKANTGLMKAAQKKGNFQVNEFTGASAYVQAKSNYDYQNALIEALQSGNAERYLAIISNYTPPFQWEERREKYEQNSQFPGKDLTYDYMNFNNRVRSYAKAGVPITFNMIQEKTALQQIQLFLLKQGPVVLIIIALFIVSDVFTQSIHHRTQRIGVPLAWGKYLFTQSLAALSFILLFFSAAVLLFFLVNGILYGFGNISWKIPQFVYAEDYVMNDSVYRLMNMSRFFWQALLFLFLLLYLFVRLSVLLSLVFRQEVVVFLVGIFILLFEKMYLSRTTRSLLGRDISNFPQTYFDFGKVITGEKNFLMNTGTITIEKGFFILGATIVTVEVLLAVAARIRTRQKFIG